MRRVQQIYVGLKILLEYGEVKPVSAPNTLAALALLARESWNTDTPEDREHWRETVTKAKVELDLLVSYLRMLQKELHDR